MSPYEEKIIEEIIEMIENNINIYYNESETNFIELRKLCRDKYDEIEEKISHQKLASLVQEVLNELKNVKHLYDYRSLE